MSDERRLSEEEELAFLDKEATSAMAAEAAKQAEAQGVQDEPPPRPAPPQPPPAPQPPADRSALPLTVQLQDVRLARGVGIELETWGQAYAMARAAVQTGLAPRGMTPEQCTLAIIHGTAVGLPTMAAIQGTAIINNRPALWGKTVVAVVRQHPAFEGIRQWFTLRGELVDIQELESDSSVGLEKWADLLTAHCALQRRNEPEHEGVFSVGMARRANLWMKEGPWKLYPAGQLMWKATHRAVAIAFPDALTGFPIAEELNEQEPREAEVVEVKPTKGDPGVPTSFAAEDVEAVR